MPPLIAKVKSYMGRIEKREEDRMWLLIAIGCMPLQFDVNGNTAVMTGDLRSNAKR